MKASISDKNHSPHYLWGENCSSWVLAKALGLSVKEESMPPGTREQLHVHEHAQQYFYILRGQATFFVDGEKMIVVENQGIHIPPGLPHYIENASGNELSFLVISQPNTDGDRKNL